MKTKHKRFLSLFLAFALVLSVASAKPQKADAIATGAVVTAIISVAIGSGLAFAVDRMTSPEVDAYWTGQAQQWLQSIGQSYSDFVVQAEQNMSAKDGKLVLGGSFYQSIQNFLSWWRGDNGVTVGSTNTSVFGDADYFLGCRIVPPSQPGYTMGSWVTSFVSEHPDAKIIPPYSFSYNGDSYSISQFTSSQLRIYKNGEYLNTANGTWVSLCDLDGTYRFITGDRTQWLGPSFSRSEVSSISVSLLDDPVVLEPTEALPSVVLDVGASSEDDLESVIRSVLDSFIDNTLVVDQELTGAGEGEGTDTDGLIGILHGISGTLSDVLDAILSIPATLAGVFTGFIGSIGNFLSGAFFGLSGIWHYVVTWVNSMRSGASLIFAVWSELPYGMVVPVYASLVAVIVIGLWKRFFG